MSDTLLVVSNTERNVLEKIKILETLRQTVPEIIMKTQNKQKPCFDRFRKNVDFKPGDKVLVYYPKNLK